jgi:hypothetical protein
MTQFISGVEIMRKFVSCNNERAKTTRFTALPEVGEISVLEQGCRGTNAARLQLACKPFRLDLKWLRQSKLP